MQDMPERLSLRFAYCEGDAFSTAHARLAAEFGDVDISANVSPYLSKGTGWKRVASGELSLMTCSGVVTDVDDTFPDADFVVRERSGITHEFVLHRSAGKVIVDDIAVVRYVQYPDSTTRPDGTIRMLTEVIEVGFGSQHK